MSLQPKVIDRIFQRCAASYGAAWDRSLGTAPLNDVKSAWGHELAGFADRLGLIAWALENLPEDPPNAIRFRNLCRQAPVLDAPPRLERVIASPERVAAELAKLQPTLKAPAPRRSNVAWAHAILAEYERTGRMNPTKLTMARAAVGRPRSTAPEDEAA